MTNESGTSGTISPGSNEVSFKATAADTRPIGTGFYTDDNGVLLAMRSPKTPQPSAMSGVAPVGMRPRYIKEFFGQ